MVRALWKASACALLALSVACATPASDSALKHIVMFDGSGEPVDAADEGGGYFCEYDTITTEEYRRRVGTTIQAIEASGRKRVVLFVHGGLNTQAATIERACRLHDEILRDDPNAFPIFVNWQSSLVTSYGDHLFNVRQGREDAFGEFKVLAPFYFIGDVARAAVRMPVVGVGQAREAVQSIDGCELDDREAHVKALRHLLPTTETGVRIARGEDAEGWFGVGTPWAVATAPVKLVSGFVVDTAGTGSWAIMKRRVDLLFERETELDGTRPARKTHGLMHLMERLAHVPGVEVDLVGHSTGALVIDRLLTEASLREHDNGAAMPVFKNIVYMAAADSIRNNFDATFTYLSHNRESRVFHLMLHENAELAESNVVDIAPRGSLLVWVDDFLGRPSSLLERTAGRADNLMAALMLVPAELRSRVHVRVFDEVSDTQPTKHGHFSSPEECDDFQFWQRTDWWPWWRNGEPQWKKPTL